MRVCDNLIAIIKLHKLRPTSKDMYLAFQDSKRSQLQHLATVSSSCHRQYLWDQSGWHLCSIKPAPFVGINWWQISHLR